MPHLLRRNSIRLIFEGGETIKDMQINTSCKINVAQPSGDDFEREIGLVGSRSAIEQAKRAIMEKVYAVVSVLQICNIKSQTKYLLGREESPGRRW